VKWHDLQDVANLKIWHLATRNDSLLPISFGRPPSVTIWTRPCVLCLATSRRHSMFY
jgi:hypothetical protein